MNTSADGMMRAASMRSKQPLQPGIGVDRAVEALFAGDQVSIRKVSKT